MRATQSGRRLVELRAPSARLPTRACWPPSRPPLSVDAIDRLATAGVTRGCNPPVKDMFCPNDVVTGARWRHASTGRWGERNPACLVAQAGSMISDSAGIPVVTTWPSLTRR